MTPSNPDKVTPPVVSGGAIGLVLAAAVRSVIDRYVDPADRELWWNLFQVALFALPVIGAWLGGLRAKRDVTPITNDATPRNKLGYKLAPVPDIPGTAPTRAARPEDRGPYYEP
jgi:hypothetical protein